MRMGVCGVTDYLQVLIIMFLSNGLDPDREVALNAPSPHLQRQCSSAK